MIQPLQSCSNKYKKGVPKHWSLTTVFRNTLLCQGLIKETENCLLPHDVEYVTVRGIDECAVVLVIELYAVLVEPCAAVERNGDRHLVSVMKRSDNSIVGGAAASYIQLIQKDVHGKPELHQMETFFNSL